MKLSTSTNMVFERINMEPISQERGILLCVQAGYRVFDFCFHDLITFKSPFLDERWEAYTEKNVRAEGGTWPLLRTGPCQCI